MGIFFSFVMKSLATLGKMWGKRIKKEAGRQSAENEWQ